MEYLTLKKIFKNYEWLGEGQEPKLNVFLERLAHGLDSDEICSSLGGWINSTNKTNQCE